MQKRTCRKVKQTLWLFLSILWVGTTSNLIAKEVGMIDTGVVQQSVSISGTVYDETGATLPGVSIRVKDTTIGTQSDVEGRYSLTVSDRNAVLVFSYLGYNVHEVTIGNQNVINVTMFESTREIDEVVVIGYGSVRKSDLTGSIASISNDKFKNLPQTSVSQILQGKAAGVNITSTSGAGNANIRIRGITSISKSSEPLWVVDGVINGVVGNVNDIQSIEVLKDASATAIYGSQGANGVILVTTKRIQGGKSQITFDTRLNWRSIRRKLDMLNAFEYATAYNDLNGETIPPEDVAAYKAGNKGINWYDLMTQTGFVQTYTLSVAGGSDKTKYKITAWGDDNKGQWITVTERNYHIKTQLDTEIYPWLNLSGYVHGYTGTSHNGNSYSQFSDILQFTPCMELTDKDGVYLEDPFSPYSNSPYGEVYARYSDAERTSMTGFADLKINLPVDGLTLSIQGLYNRVHNMSRSFSSSLLYKGNIPRADNSSSQSYRMRNINNLTYQKQFSDHRLTATAILETTKYEGSGLWGQAQEINEILGHWGLESGAQMRTNNSYINTAMVSALGRIIYSYKGKYLFTGTYRADAPSQFKDKYKWGYFPSAAVGWNISEEDFMNKDLIQMLKLRASAGITGNHGVDAYATSIFLEQANAVFGLEQEFPGYWLNSFANPDIHWEKTTQYNLGLDLGILRQRLNLTIDWYNKVTDDLLFEKDLPLILGGAKMWVNQGRIDNNGWEFTMNGWPVRNPSFIWESNLTATYTNTVIKDLAGQERILESRGGRNLPYFVMEVGKPIGTFSLFDWAGFNDEGSMLFRKKDGSLTTDPQSDDRVTTGNSIPKWLFGWSNQLNYKNWDLNIFLRATGKYNRLNLANFYTAGGTANSFITAREAYYKRWDKVADKSKAEYPKWGSAAGYPSSTQWLEQARFLRLQNITIGYQIPKSTAKIADIYLSLTGENLFVLSKYSGMDPETVSEVDDVKRDMSFGLDNGSFPIPRTFTFTLRFNF